MNTANYTINVNDYSSQLPVGTILFALEGRTKRGPLTPTVITTWPNFVKTFGGEELGNTFPTLCKRALSKGKVALLVKRLVHYSDVSNTATISARLASMSNTTLIKFPSAIKEGEFHSFGLNTYTFSQNFDINSDNTLRLLANQIAAYSQDYSKVSVISGGPTNSDDRRIAILSKMGLAPTVTTPWTVTRQNPFSLSYSAETLITFNNPILVGQTVKLSVGGITTTTVSFTSTSDNTLALLATAIEAIPGVESATVIQASGGTSNDRLINVVFNTPPALIIDNLVIAGVGTHATMATTIHVTTQLAFSGPFLMGDYVDMEVDGTAIATEIFYSNNTNDQFLIDLGDAMIAASPGTVDSVSVTSEPNSDDDDRVITIVSSSVDAVIITAYHIDRPDSVPTLMDYTSILDDTETNELFRLTPKHYGADYNNLVIELRESQVSTPGSFNLTIRHKLEPSLTEVYNNLRIVGQPTVLQSDYLKSVIGSSYLVDVEYLDLSGISPTQITPLLNIDFGFYNGHNGIGLNVDDYLGDASAATGMRAFDDFRGFKAICVPGVDNSAIHLGFLDYVVSRGDCQYYFEFDPGQYNLNAMHMVVARAQTYIDSPYCMIFGGGIKIPDLNEQIINTWCMGDILSLVAEAESKYGPQQSPANSNTTKVNGSKGVVNNFGVPARFTDLNLLANNGINMLITEEGVTYLKDFYTAQLNTSSLSFGTNVRFILHLKSIIGPIIKRYLNDLPNVPSTWNKIYLEIKDILDDYAKGERRAIISYEWVGDQNAKADLSDLVLNDINNVVLGKYKAKLPMVLAATMTEFTLDIELYNNTATFNI